MEKLKHYFKLYFLFFKKIYIYFRNFCVNVYFCFRFISKIITKILQLLNNFYKKYLKNYVNNADKELPIYIRFLTILSVVFFYKLVCFKIDYYYAPKNFYIFYGYIIYYKTIAFWILIFYIYIFIRYINK